MKIILREVQLYWLWPVLSLDLMDGNVLMVGMDISFILLRYLKLADYDPRKEKEA